MVQVKIVECNNDYTLEKEVNIFLRKEYGKIKLIDIKYVRKHGCSAMIIYEVI